MAGDIDRVGLSQRPTLLDLLDHLRSAGVAFDLDRSASHLVLTFSPQPPAQLIGDLTDHAAMLIAIAVGRYSGHAPAVCDACGDVTLIALRTTSGATLGRAGPQGGKPAPWPSCLDSRCAGRRVVRDVDREGVAAVKPPAIPRAPKPAPSGVGLPWPTDPSYRGGCAHVCE